jgi:selenide,water dikinase
VSHPDLLVGTSTFDDAGVFRLRDDLAIVQTVDFFPPLVDDPFTFGQIAAANSLSDIYAMGATPITALNIVGFPDKELPTSILTDILKGGAERAAAAEALIIGGHSVRDAEIKYGLTVTGTVHPDRVIRNDGAKPGDVLILTKPIGTGVLTTAAKKGKIKESDLAQAIAVMTHLNKDAAEAMQEVGVHAATDITGFGLLGHAYEMASAANVTFEINMSKVPLLEHALDLAPTNLTRAHKTNLAHVAPHLNAHNTATNETLLALLADAQTSGGLLIAVPAPKADALLEALKTHQSPTATPIGHVIASGTHTIRVS